MKFKYYPDYYNINIISRLFAEIQKSWVPFFPTTQI